MRGPPARGLYRRCISRRARPFRARWRPSNVAYEEYHPYGTTSWWATNGSTEVSAKRYRYTGKERDEETGLAYHGARYYAPWLARWERPDPSGLQDGFNPLKYVRANPILYRDTTGRYAEGGHYYTVFLAAFAVGLDMDMAQRTAFFAQLPDLVSDADATYTEVHKVRRGVIGVDPAEASKQLQVSKGLHALTGRSASDERAGRRKAVEAQPLGSLGLGLALHAYGDAHAHQKLSASEIGGSLLLLNTLGRDSSKMYDPGVGHARDFHAPDEIARRQALYISYATNVFDLLAAKAAPGTQSRMTRDQFVAAVTRIASIEDEAKQIQEFRSLIGLSPNDYAPEKWVAGTAANVTTAYTGHDDPSRLDDMVWSWSDFKGAPGWPSGTSDIMWKDVQDYAEYWTRQDWGYSGR